VRLLHELRRLLLSRSRGSEAFSMSEHSEVLERFRRGPELLNELSASTGAQCFVVDNPNQLPAIAKTIGIQLRNQYVLGYRPNKNAGGSSTWRKIMVRLKLPKGAPHLGVFAKSGYYSSDH